ncbi:MAG: hypothetical protein DRN78_00200 [Thermoproteota archaeon]|nr:MAG: hypothetical protein DRN78_00200 [Candidatus Korarchaeota archaeon]
MGSGSRLDIDKWYERLNRLYELIRFCGEIRGFANLIDVILALHEGGVKIGYEDLIGENKTGLFETVFNDLRVLRKMGKVSLNFISKEDVEEGEFAGVIIGAIE